MLDGVGVDGMWFEDLEVGRRFTSGGRTLGEGELMSFALAYDPQYLHLDAERATAGAFGGLIASGFQTLALAWWLFIRTGLLEESSRGGIGLDEVRWTAPVRPGDTLRVETVVTERGEPKRGRGRVVFAHTVRNQRDEVVLTYRSIGLVATRPA
jgi:acyl dehydratase